MFSINPYPNDAIEGVFERLARDTSPDKIDLGIGVFRDDAGKVPVMQSVRQAESQLIARAGPKSYLSPLGNQDYCRDVEKLAFGNDHPVLQQSRVISAQTPGAGSALRVAAEFVHALTAESAVWVSQPVWDHQPDFFRSAGVPIRSYRYYDQQKSRGDFAGMLDDLAAMQTGDLLLLHGCCHNPTGHDLSIDEWQQVTELALATGAIPFVDVAYQGFGAGIAEDVAGLRLMAEQVPEMLLTVSSSKSFGIYRERAGLLSVVVAPDIRDRESVRRRFRDTIRNLYFMAPDHGAAIVHEILSTPALTAMWQRELDKIRQHVTGMRRALRLTLEDANPGFDAAFIESQRGMFSCLPLRDDEQRHMEDQFHIYMLPNARVNVAAMSARQSAVLADAFAFVRQHRSGNARQANA